MSIFFHAKTRGFFDEAVHGRRTIVVPDPDWKPSGEPEEFAPWIEQANPTCSLPPAGELVEISETLYTDLFSAQTSGEQVIAAGKDGHPVLKPAPGPTVEELQRRERQIRDAALLSTDPLVARHRDELEAGGATMLTKVQYQQLQGYRQELRDWPESKDFPSKEKRPVAPEWLIELQEG